jgi:MoaA/NifB/PqqE/SkfB family radical SAM enzyme
MAFQGGRVRIKSPFRAFAGIFLKRGLVEAQLIVTRRCNLSCGYCTQYDNVSAPVPLPALLERIDALHRLGAVQIALLGGEPLTHPGIDRIVAHANRASQVSLTTNGFLVTDDLVERLNRAGLSHMQVSIDSLNPDSELYIQKSMKTIRGKLARLKAAARFSVHANIVLCEKSKPEFREIVRELRALEIPVTVNLLHDGAGRVLVSGEEYVELWEHHYRRSLPISYIEREYGRALLRGRTPDWTCRAGRRHVYVDEHGRAQYCHAQSGRLDVPIVEYTAAEMSRYGDGKKGCESGCSVFCVFRASQVDNDPGGLLRALWQSFRRGSVSLRLPRAGPAGPGRRRGPDRSLDTGTSGAVPSSG